MLVFVAFTGESNHLCLLSILSCLLLKVWAEKGPLLTLSVEPVDVVTVSGSSVLLQCRAETSSPHLSPSVKWRTPDGQYINYIGDTTRSQLSNGSLLLSSVFGESDLEGSGGLEQYQCVATLDNVGSIVSRTASITLARLPPFEQQPSEQRVFPSQTAHFACHVDAQPPPTVTWLKDQRPLVLDEARMVILPSGSLEIDEVQISDRGSYRCNVTGLDRHRLSESAALTVSQDLESASSTMGPVFIATPRLTVVLEGSTVTLDCAANGNPRPWITWLKDGVSLDMADLDSRYRKVGVGSLQISGVLEQDGGNYQCRAENREDSIDSTATLHVQVAPRFLQRPHDVSAHEKDDVELECQVYGRPEPKITWLKNGDVITQNDYLHIVNGNNLRILGLMSLDSGLFQCVASNPAGNVQAAALLTILNLASVAGEGPVVESAADDVPLPPQGLEAAIIGARFLTLRWRPPEAPRSDIAMYSVYYRQEGSQRERVVNTSRSRLQEANLPGLQPDRGYLVRVAAVTAGGRAGHSSAALRVQTSAEVNVPGAPLALSAVPLATTQLRVTWLAPHTSNGPVQRYKLYYIQTDSSEEHHVVTSELHYELTGLRVYTEYSLWVVAFNANGPGAASEEITARTPSDVPSEPPSNVTLETASSTSVIIRWEEPPTEGQNGVITGYKLRYRKKDRRGRGDTVTTPGNRRLYAITDLEKSTVYQVRLWALNVNGTSPPTDWITIETYDNDLDESTVPEAPSAMRVRPSTDSITITWSPPANQNIMVRGYTIGWGKGVPDAYSQLLDGKHRQFVIKGLEANSEYVMSLRANNEMGAGPPIYENVRTREESAPEPVSPLIPPVGLKAIVLSSSTVVLYWTDSTLSHSQLVTDSRYYVVRYTSFHHSAVNPRYKYYNSTDLNYMIDDLKANTQYEFTVKVVKAWRESPWSMVVLNTTQEAAPSSPPRDLTVVPLDNNPTLVNLNWQPPKQPNGQITGYVVSYTTDLSQRDRDWVVEGVVGDKMTTNIKGLTPSTTYYFKIQARNNKGYGPMSSTVSMTTAPGSGIRIYESAHSIKDGRAGLSNTTLLYLLLACCTLLVSSVAIIAAIICCRRASTTQQRTKKGYSKGSEGVSSIKPPDLWIHHDQMELKALEKSSQGSLDHPPPPTSTSTDDYKATNSLDKRAYTTNYVGSASQPLLLPEEKTSTARRIIKPKPITLPVENQPFREPMASTTPLGGSTSLSAGLSDPRPVYPRTQYSMRAHVTLDPAAENPYLVQATGGLPGAYETLAAPQPGVGQHPAAAHNQSSYGVVGEGSGSMGKRQQGHPLKSFSVPAPPPQSAPSTPQQKHIVTVRPQGSSPYKKAGHFVSTTASPVPVAAQKKLDDLPKIQPSYSTEELNQEMANLEGLMKDLNAITASEFEC